MLRTIRIYGRLAKFLKRRKFEAEVSSAAEAVRFLLANFPQLERHMADQHYRVSVGGYDLAEDELHDPAGQQEIKIVPVLAGAGGSSPLGTGGDNVGTNVAANAATGYGSGGSGSVTLNASALSGGAGSAGVIIVYEYA